MSVTILRLSPVVPLLLCPVVDVLRAILDKFRIVRRSPSVVVAIVLLCRALLLLLLLSIMIGVGGVACLVL